MKKFITTALLIATAFLIGKSTPTKANTEPEPFHYYAKTCMVTEINPETDIVTTEDYNGNTWEFYGTEDWLPGDICSMVMDDKGTENIYDDEIVNVRYSGYFSFD